LLVHNPAAALVEQTVTNASRGCLSEIHFPRALSMRNVASIGSGCNLIEGALMQLVLISTIISGRLVWSDSLIYLIWHWHRMSKRTAISGSIMDLKSGWRASLVHCGRLVVLADSICLIEIRLAALFIEMAIFGCTISVSQISTRVRTWRIQLTCFVISIVSRMILPSHPRRRGISCIETSLPLIRLSSNHVIVR